MPSGSSELAEHSLRLPAIALSSTAQNAAPSVSLHYSSTLGPARSEHCAASCGTLCWKGGL